MLIVFRHFPGAAATFKQGDIRKLSQQRDRGSATCDPRAGYVALDRWTVPRHTVNRAQQGVLTALTASASTVMSSGTQLKCSQRLFNTVNTPVVHKSEARRSSNLRLVTQSRGQRRTSKPSQPAGACSVTSLAWRRRYRLPDNNTYYLIDPKV